MSDMASIIQNHKTNILKDPAAATSKECEHFEMKIIL